MLVALFVLTSRAVGLRLQAAGLPATVDVERTIIERDGPIWSPSKRAVAYPVLLSRGLPDPPLLGETEIASVRRCAGALAEVAKDTLPYWTRSPGRVGPLIDVACPGSHFESDPAGWVTRTTILPALFHHVAALPSPENAHETDAQAFADETMMVATRTQLEYILSVPVSGIDPVEGADALTVGRVSVRRLSAVEQGAIFDQRGGAASLTTYFNEIPRTMLELRTSGPREQEYVRSYEEILPLITAFQLHGFRPAGHYMAEHAEPAWVSGGGVTHRQLLLPKQPRQAAPLTAEILQAITATAKRLERFHVGEPASSHDLALHRFATGLARNSYADGVLDFTIALEALLLPYDRDARRGDLGYRFRLHGAHYLAARADERPTIAKHLSTIYETRSRLVHGAKYPDREQIRVVHDAAYDFARRGLLRAVQEDFPTAPTFNEMVLG